MAINHIGNRKHLTLDDRIRIETLIEQGANFSRIAKELEKSSSTISKEIRRHRFLVPHYHDSSNRRRSECVFYEDCNVQGLCGNNACSSLCSRCRSRRCTLYCSSFQGKLCDRLLKPPYVCNACPRLRACSHDFYFYRARHAQESYHNTRKETRSGINQTPESLEQLDRLISPLLKQGQPLSHIYMTHPQEIACSLKTLYNYIDQGLFSAINLDLPRKVRYKPRKKQSLEKEIPGYREGRTYEHFKELLKENPELNVVEMDVVEGCRGQEGKVLLTLFFRNCSLMLAFLMEGDTRGNVLDVFYFLLDKLGEELFSKTFPLILTDNGASFKNPFALESLGTEKALTHIYYCDPMSSWQKGRLEKNHEFIRYILPKGYSFDVLTPEKVQLMINHINSTARASLNDHTPFELAQLLLDRKVLEVCGLKPIPPEQVVLKPSLLNL